MIVYILLLVLLLIPVIRFDLMKIEGNRTLWLYIIWTALVLVSGLRYRVGGDTIVYMQLFRDYPAIGELSGFDFNEAKFNPGWYVLNSFFKSYGNSFILFQIAEAAIIQTCFFRFFKRYSPNSYFTCILLFYIGYFCYLNMEIMRESLCICLFLEACPFLEKRRYVPYYLLCILAMTFHTSAFVTLLLPLMLLLKRDRWWLWVLIGLGIVYLLQVLDIVTILLQLAFSDSLAAVIRGYIAKMTERTMAGVVMELLVVVPFLVLAWVRARRGYVNDNEFGAMLTLLFISQISGIFIPGVNRFGNYVLPLGLVLIVNTFYQHYWDLHWHSISRMAVYCSIFLYCFNLSFFYMKSQRDSYRGSHVWNRYVPYYSVLNPKEDSVRELMMANERAADPVFNKQSAP